MLFTKKAKGQLKNGDIPTHAKISEINMDQNTRRAQLVTSFRDRALTWFMNFSSTQNYVLVDIKKAMIKEFKKPKSKSQSITELKEIQ